MVAKEINVTDNCFYFLIHGTISSGEFKQLRTRYYGATLSDESAGI
jgi:hypothetical protein